MQLAERWFVNQQSLQHGMARYPQQLMCNHTQQLLMHVHTTIDQVVPECMSSQLPAMCVCAFAV